MAQEIELDELAEVVSETLELASDETTARKLRKQISTLRGLRGVPPGEIARIAGSTWEAAQPTLPDAEEPLNQLFGTAWEDGIVAVGLLAAALPDAPADALRVGLRWADRLDEHGTADALGWLVLGPAALLSGDPLQALAPVLAHERTAARRAAAMAAMAWLPERIEGPAAAPVRARLGQRHVQWVDAPRSDAVAALLDRLVRDEAPEVRKAVRRVLRAWTDADPAAVADWGERWRRAGGLPRLLSDEVERARRRAGPR